MNEPLNFRKGWNCAHEGIDITNRFYDDDARRGYYSYLAAPIDQQVPFLIEERNCNRYIALYRAVKKAEQMFSHYGDLHAGKDNRDKARANYDLAREMRDALRVR